MEIITRSTIKRLAPLRTVLALVFLILTSIQPGAMSFAHATGFHGNMATAAAPRVPSHLQMQDHAADQEMASAINDDTQRHQYDDKWAGGKTCEVYCAAVSTLLATYPALQGLTNQSFAPEPDAAFQPGEYVELLRPPKSLN